MVGRRWLAAGVALVALVGAAVVSAASIERGATVTQTATRVGEQIQGAPTLAPPAGCHRLAVIGDSLTVAADPWLRPGLASAGFTFVVDAHISRQIPEQVRAPYSGVKAARSVRSTWGEADCWVVALGSNDLDAGAGRSVAEATGRIDEMLTAITPGADVWWVNVDYHPYGAAVFDMTSSTRHFNEALDRRAAALPALTVIDWYSSAEANLHWFYDPVHVRASGSIAWVDLIVTAVPVAR